MNGLLIVLAATALLLAPIAEGRDGRPGVRAQAQGQSEAKKRPGPVQRGERPRRPDQGKRAPGRLTQEERRDLHRDLDRANREIYRR
ncbi:MAG TPA: hypothetical protein VMN03_16900 [Burkholderiales bacterium]|nr:hypothetical protein [Burkholderiales bacterium]